MNIANSRYHKVRKIEKSEQNKVGKNEKIGIIRLEKLNIMYKSGLEKLRIMKQQEEIMIERKAKVTVNEWITHGNDAFLLTGARQIGKTYLIRQCLK